MPDLETKNPGVLDTIGQLLFDSDTVPAGFTISDSSVDAAISTQLDVLDSSSSYVGFLIKINGTLVPPIVSVVWIYVTGDTDISGTGTLDGEPTTVDLKLKAGWNRAIVTEAGSGDPVNFYSGAEPAGLSWLLFFP
ncbi:MAG: hypothetical protein ACOC8L_10465 [Spirochaetota bacterium]